MTTTTFVSASEKQLKATVNEFYGSCHAMVMVISKHDQRVVGQWPLNSGPKWLPLKSSKKLYLDNKCMSISVFQRLYLYSHHTFICSIFHLKMRPVRPFTIYQPIELPARNAIVFSTVITTSILHLNLSRL